MGLLNGTFIGIILLHFHYLLLLIYHLYEIIFLDNLIWNADPDNYGNSYDVKLFTICLCTIMNSDYIC
jgi:hypothetical protein